MLDLFNDFLNYLKNGWLRFKYKRESSYLLASSILEKKLENKLMNEVFLEQYLKSYKRDNFFVIAYKKLIKGDFSDEYLLEIAFKYRLNYFYGREEELFAHFFFDKYLPLFFEKYGKQNIQEFVYLYICVKNYCLDKKKVKQLSDKIDQDFKENCLNVLSDKETGFKNTFYKELQNINDTLGRVCQKKQKQLRDSVSFIQLKKALHEIFIKDKNPSLKGSLYLYKPLLENIDSIYIKHRIYIENLKSLSFNELIYLFKYNTLDADLSEEDIEYIFSLPIKNYWDNEEFSTKVAEYLNKHYSDNKKIHKLKMKKIEEMEAYLKKVQEKKKADAEANKLALQLILGVIGATAVGASSSSNNDIDVGGIARDVAIGAVAGSMFDL